MGCEDSPGPGSRGSHASSSSAPDVWIGPGKPTCWLTTVFLHVMPAFSGIVNRVLLSNIQTFSSLTCLRRRMSKSPFTPCPSLQLQPQPPPAHSKIPPECCLHIPSMFPRHSVPPSPLQAGFCSPHSTKMRPLKSPVTSRTLNLKWFSVLLFQVFRQLPALLKRASSRTAQHSSGSFCSSGYSSNLSCRSTLYRPVSSRVLQVKAASPLLLLPALALGSSIPVSARMSVSAFLPLNVHSSSSFLSVYSIVHWGIRETPRPLCVPG